MISMNNKKYLSNLKWVGLIILAMISAKLVIQGSQSIDILLSEIRDRTAGDVNLIITYAILALLPFAPFVLIRLKPINLIAVTVALLPFFARIERIFGIYAYTDFNGNPIYISGISLFAPLLLAYLVIRYPSNENIRAWLLPSSKAFWLFAIFGVITQFVFYDIFSALRIGYIVVVVQLLFYMIVIAYVNSVEDIYKITWGIIIAVSISILLTVFTSEQEIELFDPNFFIRLESNSLGPNNYYAALLSSSMCMLPFLYYKAHKWGKIFILATFLVLLKFLILTGARGAYVSLLPIIGYIFIIRTKTKKIIFILIALIIGIFFFQDQISIYLTKRPLYYDLHQVPSFEERLLSSKEVLQELLDWPYFFTGFGMGTIDNWFLSRFSGFPVQGVHQGFLNVWVNAGFIALLGFMYWLGYAIWAGIRKIKISKDTEEVLVIFSLIICILSWLIVFMTTGGWYISKNVELYAILTAEVGMLVVLGQKWRIS
jgi:hypothetical protein